MNDLLRELITANKTGILDLSHGGIEAEKVKYLAQNLKKYPNIKTVNLSHNRIGDGGIKVFAKGLKGSSIKTLDLSHNQIRVKDQALVKGILGSKLEKLSIDYNGIEDVGAKAFVKGILGSNLKDLSIRGNNIGDVVAGLFGKILPGSKLEKLSMGYNGIGPEGVKDFVKGILASNLKDLSICGNNIGAVGAGHIADVMSNLRKLDISSNNIGPEGARRIGEAIPGSPNLKEISIGVNNIGPEGAEGFAKGVLGSKLEKVCIAANNIGAVGAGHVADAMSNLKELNMCNNNIGDAGAIYLGERMSGSNLRKLDISLNNIGDAGAGGTVGGQLEEVDLRLNNIGDAGAEDIANRMSNLLKINLSYNKIGDKGCISIANAMEGNTKLIDLNMWNNNTGDEGAKCFYLKVDYTNIKYLNILRDPDSTYQLGINQKIELCKEIDSELRTLFGKGGIGCFDKSDKPGTLKFNTANLKAPDDVKAFFEQCISTLKYITSSDLIESRAILSVKTSYNCTYEDAKGVIDCMQSKVAEFIGTQLECSPEDYVEILSQFEKAGLSKFVKELLVHRANFIGIEDTQGLVLEYMGNHSLQPEIKDWKDYTNKMTNEIYDGHSSASAEDHVESDDIATVGNTVENTGDEM